MLLAYKVGYFGENFHGSQIQPGVRTVQGEISRVLREEGIGEVVGMASRTDAGVSALGNVVVLKIGREIPLSWLNSLFDDIFFHGWARVPPDFNPRRARLRWYRYVYPEPLEPVDLNIFTGRKEYRSLVYHDNPLAEITSVEMRTTDNYTILDFYAPYFRRQMVRRMVTLISMVSRGEVEDPEVYFREKRPIAPAPPEYLILMDVKYGFPFYRDDEVLESLKDLFRERERRYLGLWALFHEGFSTIAEPHFIKR